MLLSKKGFTLIELLIVIIIVGILAAVSMPMLTANFEKAKWTEAVAMLGAIRTACRLYHSEFGEYPTTAYNLNGAQPSPGIPEHLQFDLDKPDAEGRYVYRSETDTHAAPYGRRLAYAFIDTNLDGIANDGDGYIEIFANGLFKSGEGAPEF